MDMPPKHSPDNNSDLNAATFVSADKLVESSHPLDGAALQRLQALDPGGENQLLQRVLDAFQRSLQHGAGQLQAAAQIEDLKSVRHVVHTLKSSSANVGANQLSQRCAELETLLRIDQVDNLKDRIDELCQEIALVAKALQALLES